MNIVVVFNILSLKYSVVIYILPSMKLHIFSKLWIEIVLRVEHITWAVYFKNIFFNENRSVPTFFAF